MTAEPVRPRYGTSSLAEVLPSALAALGVPGPNPLDLPPVRRIAVLLVDGLGYEQLPLMAPYAPTLADILAGRLGRLAAITAGFPSTTPTSLVTLGTGAPPGEHGVLGFTVNVPGTDRVLTHIDWVHDPIPAMWQPVPTQFARARAAGVAVSVVSRPQFAGSGLTVAAYGHNDFRGAPDLDTLAREMLDALRQPSPVLVYGYHPELDSQGHLYGVDSPQWREAAVGVDRLLERLIYGLPPGAALVVTADHGQLNVPPAHRFDIDADARLSAGVRVVAGEPRVRYLHSVPGADGDVLAAWREVLGDAAWVATRAEAVDTGWYGSVPPEHLARIGDVVAVCRDTYAVLSSGTEPALVGKLVAFHGSYTPAEMIIPLISVVPRV